MKPAVLQLVFQGPYLVGNRSGQPIDFFLLLHVWGIGMFSVIMNGTFLNGVPPDGV